MIDTLQLRCSIVSLALSGKLTTQFQSENARNILAKINSTKDLEIKENIPYNVPNNWCWARLSDVYDFNPKVQAEPDKTAAFIPMEKISAGFSGNYLYDEQTWEKASKNHTKFVNGDVAFAKISPCFENRKSFVAENLPNGIGGGTTELIILRQLNMLPDYTYLLITDQRFIKTGSGSYKGIVGQQRIKRNFLNEYLIPIAPIEEQRRVIKIVGEAFTILDTIDNIQSRYIVDIEVLKSRLIDAGIQGKLTEQIRDDGDVAVLYERLKEEKTAILKNRKGREDKKIKEVGDDIPYELPLHWKWVRLGEIGLFKKGPFGSTLTKSMFIPKSEETVKVYEQQHAIQKDASLGTYYISREYFDEKMSDFEVESGDIIISCAGTIGETYILPEEIEQGIINQALMRVVLVDSVDKEFFQYYFDANLKKMAQNESNGSAIKNIPPFDVMKNWYFPLTSLEEQRRIVEKLNQLLNIV